MKNPLELYLKHPWVFTGSDTINPDALLGFLSDFKRLIYEMETRMTRSEIVNEIADIRKIACESRFIQRTQIWPRGYQGDFETIEYIIKGENLAPKNSIAYCIEDFFIHSDICNQHKNKVNHQAEMIKQTIHNNPLANIISIGCGTSEDVVKAMDTIQKCSATITLVDIDEGALSYSMQRLEQIKNQVYPMKGNIYKIMRSLKSKYDLIIIGGVFDYLNDKTIVSILQSLHNNLSASGKIFFTNIDIHNPYRIFMEYLSDWILVERSKEDIARLIHQAGWKKEMTEINKDSTRLTHLITLSNQAVSNLKESTNTSMRA